MALHERLHQLGHGATQLLGQQKPDPSSWALLLDWFIDKIVQNRKLIALHERNRAALEKLHSVDHDRDHEDLEQQLRSALGDRSLPAVERVRMACALGAVIGGLMIGGDNLSDLPPEQLSEELRRTVRDLLTPRTRRRTARRDPPDPQRPATRS